MNVIKLHGSEQAFRFNYSRFSNLTVSGAAKMLKYCINFITLIAISNILISDTGRCANAGEHSELHVAVSIKPLHSLVAGVMEGVGKPYLIIRSGASPHSYQLKPSDAKALERSRLVFWIGPQFEIFLTKPIQSIGINSESVTLVDTKRLVLRKNRIPSMQSGRESHHQTYHRHHNSDSGSDSQYETDMHIWLDPKNAKLIVGEIVKYVSAADPKNSIHYQRNGDKIERRLDKLMINLNAGLKPVRDRPYIVFHDAYQYLEKRFNLSKAVSVLVSPDRRPGAETIRLLRRRIEKHRPLCAFSEPQFDPRILRILLEKRRIEFSTLDPVGVDMAPGPDLYFDMMRNIGKSLTTCLSRES